MIHGFELIDERDLPELNTHARLFRHARTGAELLSLENNDENKVFGITFRTPPNDSTGVPHIMEHSVLCGSRKYPLKEPFVELIKGSLNTFLNAFTYPDKTCYPVASQNLQDFYNLIDVYVDAVFYPLIPPHTLEQEGWHYELDEVGAPLKFKGVVFNEMKGAYSSPDNVLMRYSQQSLYPATTYGVDSGGDPTVIPDLTYEAFKSFHETYYHPSNARIFFYGDDNPDERLRLMDGYLSGFDRQEVRSHIERQPRLDAPRRETISYDASEEDGSARKGMLTMNWMFDETADPQEALGMRMLAYILIGTAASPLRKALIDSGLGEDLAGGGLDEDLLQPYFSTGLKGIALEDAARVETLIVDTLQALAEKGIDRDTVAAAVNTVEFRLRENNTGSFPRGLALMLRSLTSWLYDRDPLAPLAFDAPLGAIRARLEAGEPYFENLIRSHFLENQHRTTVILKPDPELSDREEAAERARLDAVRAELSPDELAALVENTRRLKLLQETPDSLEALATLPRLKLEDLDREVKRIPIENLKVGGNQVLYHDLFTNGILYLDLGFDLHSLPQELLPYISLFGRALIEMGTESEDFVKLSQRIGRSTGGIRPAAFTSSVYGATQSIAWLFLRGKSTLPQVGELFKILRDVLLTVKLDNRERFRQMVLEEKADQEAMLVPAGHRVVNSRLRSMFTEADWAAEQMGGVSYLYFLRELAKAVDVNWPAVLAQLEAIRAGLLHRGALLANVTLDEAGWQEIRPQLAAFLESLPAGQEARVDWRPELVQYNEGLTIPAQVNYVALGANLYELGYQLSGSIAVITNYLRTTWLWEKIRVQGGAYGGMCSFDHRSGVFSYLSYRDPNLLETIENYHGAARFLRQLDIDPGELTKSITGAIGDMDAYQLPDAKGYTAMLRYLAGESDEDRQRRREQIFATNAEDFHRLGEILEGVNTTGPVVVMGAAENIQAANEARGGWLDVKKVL